ncbi:MAG: acetylornithine/succinylornithine family transaminase [Planctomycetota bacterium]
MDEHVLRTYVRQPEVFVEGKGATIRDESGREWLDFLGGIAVSALGHGHPKLVAALSDQARKALHVSNLFRNPYTEKVASALCRLSGMEAVFFTNSGAEANECALKLARKAMRVRGDERRTGYVAIEGGFHGRTMGALSVTSGAKYREPFGPLVPGVTFVPRNDVAALKAALDAGPAGLILEPIQGEGGVVALDPAFLRAARTLCDSTGTILIHDEVQCGTGRTGRFLCSQWWDAAPDVVTLAKPLAAGLPMGACLVRKGLEGTFQPGDHGSTFAGGPFVLRAAHVLLGELENGLLGNVVERGEQFREGLTALQREFPRIAELRGRGLIQGVRVEGAAELQKQLYRNGLLANCTANDVIRFLPPYIVTADDVVRALDIIRHTLRG